MISVQCLLLVLVAAAVSARRPCLEERQTASDLKKQYPGLINIPFPTCEDDGTYSPKQCILAFGTLCDCVDAKGNRIDGYSYYTSIPGTPGCRCAREKDYLSHHVIGRTIACDKFGNYERNQCTGSKCNCVNPVTGEKIGDAVPISEKNKLNC